MNAVLFLSFHQAYFSCASAIFSINIYWKTRKSYIPLEYKNINFRELTTSVSVFHVDYELFEQATRIQMKVSYSLANWTIS